MGELIKNGATYFAQIITMPDGSVAQLPELSEVSTPRTLHTEASPFPESYTPTIVDIDNNHNASDFELTFSRVSDESTISEYRVFLIHVDHAIRANGT